jgi:hypothetical protein
MKKSDLIFAFFLFLLSCIKDNDTPPNPGWLNDRISQLEGSAFHIGASVTLYKWNNEYYYHIINPISSCMFCDFYDYAGNKFEWTTELSGDFQKNAKMVMVVWSGD